MKYTKYPELKSELKELAKEIHYLKSFRPLRKRLVLETFIEIWNLDYKIRVLSNKFRHRHIAYCMLRGREYEQIERHCEVPPNFGIVKKIMAEYEQETLCASA